MPSTDDADIVARANQQAALIRTGRLDELDLHKHDVAARVMPLESA